MDRERMQSLISALVRKVEDASRGEGPDAAIQAIVHGLARYVSEYEADLVEQEFQSGFAVVSEVDPRTGKRGEMEIAPRLLQEQIRLWSHMYGVLDKAGLKLRDVPRRPRKRGRAKQRSTAKGARMAASKARRKAMQKALRGT